MRHDTYTRPNVGPACPPPATARPTGSVTAELEQLEKDLFALGDAHGRLVNAIEPALTPEPAAELSEGNPGAGGPTSCTLAMRAAALAYRVRNMTRDINGVADRVQI